jgi:hypothetical protein
VRIEVVQGDRLLPKDEAAAVLAAINLRFAAKQEERSRLQRRLDRVQGPAEHTSISRAMILVEARLAKAFWTIAQQTSGTALRPTESSQHGIGYLHDHVDNYARYADAPSGDWKSAMPTPTRPIPSNREIDAATEAQSWLLFVDEDDRKLLVVGATSKRGDAGRNVNWKRIKEGRPELKDIPVRTLQARYQNALRSIVLALALAQAA